MDKKELKTNKLEFNTYCTFTEERHSLEETIGEMFKDYIERFKMNR